MTLSYDVNKRRWHSTCQEFNTNDAFLTYPERQLMKLAGIILIILGVVALVYQNFSYTKTEKDAQLGPIEIQHQETHSVPIPPIVGGVLALVAGERRSL